MDLIVSQYGTRIRKSGKRIVLFNPRTNRSKEYPARELAKILILRPSSISTGAVSLALDFDIDIVFLGKHGMPVGRLFPSKRGSLTLIRQKQAEASNSIVATLLAKKFVESKGASQLSFLSFLEREHKTDFSTSIAKMEAYLESISPIKGCMAEARPQLLAIEGNIARQYFSCLEKLIRFPGRVTQNAKDAFNVMLNYGYGILYNEIERCCLYTGLDPYIGFYHSDRYGHVSLVFDLIEEFRVPFVDSVVVGIMLKNGGKTEFARNGVLSQEGKKELVGAIYSKMGRKIKWKGQVIASRDAIKRQTLHLARYLTGKDVEYFPFKWERY